MSDIRFIKRWEKSRKKGLALYLTEYAVGIPIGGVIGKNIGEYFYYHVLFRPFHLGDFIALIVLIILGFLLGLCNWNRSEKRYGALMDVVNK